MAVEKYGCFVSENSILLRFYKFKRNNDKKNTKDVVRRKLFEG